MNEDVTADIPIIHNHLTEVLKAYGVVGLVTYVGSLILLIRFNIETDFRRQMIFGITGVILLCLSIFITYFRLKIQRDREKALIGMVESSCSRLAEQLGKALPPKQLDGILQKMRQMQTNLLNAIAPNSSDNIN